MSILVGGEGRRGSASRLLLILDNLVTFVLDGSQFTFFYIFTALNLCFDKFTWSVDYDMFAHSDPGQGMWLCWVPLRLSDCHICDMCGMTITQSLSYLCHLKEPFANNLRSNLKHQTTAHFACHKFLPQCDVMFLTKIKIKTEYELPNAWLEEVPGLVMSPLLCFSHHVTVAIFEKKKSRKTKIVITRRILNGIG